MAGLGMRTLFPVVAVALALLASPIRVSGAEPPPEPPDRLQFDVGFDGGITYRYASDLSGLEPTGWLRGVSIEGRIGWQLSLDGGFAHGDPASPDGWTGSVRQARVYTRGHAVRWFRTDYAFEFGIEDGDGFLNDFSLAWHPGYGADSLQVGYFGSPMSLGNAVSSGALPLLEVAAPVSAFAPGDRLGIQLAGAVEEPSLSWAMKLSSVGQSQKVGDASDQPLQLGGRVVWRPAGVGADDAPLWHVGASLGWAPESSGSEVQYRSRPESFLVDDVVDTGEIDGGATVFGLEGLWRRRQWDVQSEVLVASVDASDGGSPTFTGAYLAASLVLTGEVRAYDPGGAVLGRVVPHSPLAFGAGGGRGALQLTTRLSWLDLSDEGVEGGRLLALSVGPVWTWNERTRVLAGIVIADVDDRPDDGWLGIFQTRLELRF